MSYNHNITLAMFCIVILIVCLSFLQPNYLTAAFAEMGNSALDTIRTSVTANSTSSNLNSWGCLKELSPKDNECYDMSNAASAYLGIIAGAAVGGVITWWIYNLQNKTSRKQDHILNHIEEIEQKNRKILIHLEAYAKHQDLVLNKIFLLNENIQALNQKMQNMAEKLK
jgi:hypothetical protein